MKALSPHLALAVVLAGGVTLISSTAARAEDLSRTRVAYAGFAMVGAYSDLDSLYPFSRPLSEELNRTLLAKVGALTPDSYDLYTTQLLDADEGNTVALAFALDHEKVSVEQVAGTYKALIDISAQALVYDFDGEERAIIASYPVVLPAYIDIFERPPTDAQIAERVRAYYLGGLDGVGSLLDEFVGVVRQADIRQKYAQEIGIGQVIVTERASGKLATAPKEADTLQQFIGRRVAAELARNQSVSVIPYQVDSSVADLAMRFTGQRSTTFLRLPEPEYLIDFAVLDLTKEVYAQSDVGTTFIFGTYAQIRLREAQVEERALFKQFVSVGRYKKVPVTSGAVDDRAASLDSLLSLISDFSKEVSGPSRQWQKGQELSSSDRKEYRAFGEVLERCR